MITIYEKNSKEYKALQVAASMMTMLSPNGYTYVVDNTYFDFGQDWMWTTIICEDRGFQALYPAMHEKICDGTVEEIAELVHEHFEDKHCCDRK